MQLSKIKRVGIIHAYPSTYIVDSLVNAGFKVVLIGNSISESEFPNVEAIIDTPLWNEYCLYNCIEKYNMEKPFAAMLPVNEGTLILTAKIAQQLNLPCLQVSSAVISRNKYLSYQLWRAQGIPVPKTYIATTLEDTWRHIEKLPRQQGVLKLVDSMNSQGIIHVRNKTECENALDSINNLLDQDFQTSLETDRNRYAYGNSDVKSIVQEFCEGIEVSVELFLRKNEKPIVLAILEKIPSRGPYFAEIASVTPTSLGEDDEAELSDLAIKAVQALGLQYGPAHVEIRYANREAYVLEAGLRAGGGFTAQLIESLSGFNIFQAQAFQACNLPIPVIEKSNSKSKTLLFGGCVYEISGILKKVIGLEIFDELSQVENVVILNKEGDLVKAMPESAQPHYCYYIVTADTYSEAVSCHDYIQSRIHLKIESI